MNVDRVRFLKCFSLLFSFGLVCSAARAGTPAPAAPAEIEFDRNEYGMIYFKGPDAALVPPPLKTDLEGLKYVGRLRPAAGDPNPLPYFLFLAKEGEAETAIHALRPPAKGSARQVAAFVQPGKITDPKSGNVVMDSRAFVGRCLARVHADVYAVFQKERVDRRSRLQSSVFIAQSGPEHLDEKLVESRLPSINETLRLVKLKGCHEIEARNRLMLRRPLDLRPKRELTPEDDEDRDEKGEADKPGPDGEPKGAVEIGA